MFKLNIVGAESAAMLVRLWNDTYKQAYGEIFSAENLEAYCTKNYTLERANAELSNPTTVCVIAQQGDRPVGYYMVKHHECPVGLDGGSSELKQIYILADHYGLGLGKLLYQDALIEIMSEGKRWIWLCVADNNVRAQAFYKKHDFKPIGTGPTFEIGTDRLPSTILARPV